MILGFKPAASPVLAVAGDGGPGLLAVAGAPDEQGALARALGVLVTFNIVCLAWIFFRAESLDYALAYLNGLTDWSRPVEQVTPFLLALVLVSLAAHFLSEDLVERVSARIENFGVLGLGAILGFGILLIWAVAPDGVAPFIYFQF